MLLVLMPPGGAEQRLWVTRRLWLALYRAVAAMAPQAAEEPTMKVPPSASKPIPAQDAADARRLDSVNIKPAPGDGIALAFRFEGGPVGMSLPPQGVSRFRHMLETQADRAGWDAAAAMERLRAEAQAGAAVRRASA